MFVEELLDSNLTKRPMGVRCHITATVGYNWQFVLTMTFYKEYFNCFIVASHLQIGSVGVPNDSKLRMFTVWGGRLSIYILIYLSRIK